MPTVTTTVHIERPVGEVFAFLADFGNLASFQGTLAGVDVESPVSLGTRGVMHRVQGKRKFDFPFEITAYKPDRELSLEGVGGGLALKAMTLFSPAGQGTEMVHRIEFRAQGLLVLMQPVIKAAIKKEEKVSAARLKQVLEAA